VNYENDFAWTKKRNVILKTFLCNVVCTSMQLDFETVQRVFLVLVIELYRGAHTHTPQ